MTTAEAFRVGALCQEMLDAFQAGRQTKEAYLLAFAEVLQLAGGPVEAHGVLVGCAEDPSWVDEVKAAFKGLAAA